MSPNNMKKPFLYSDRWIFSLKKDTCSNVKPTKTQQRKKERISVLTTYAEHTILYLHGFHSTRLEKIQFTSTIDWHATNGVFLKISICNLGGLDSWICSGYLWKFPIME